MRTSSPGFGGSGFGGVRAASLDKDFERVGPLPGEHLGFGFMVYGLWFKLWGLGLRVSGLRFMVHDLWFRVWGSHLRVYDLAFMVWGGP